MKLSKVVSSVLLASSMAMFVPSAVMGAGGGSGSKITLPVFGQIGEVMVDPYDISPLTAVIKNGGYVLNDAKEAIEPVTPKFNPWPACPITFDPRDHPTSTRHGGSAALVLEIGRASCRERVCQYVYIPAGAGS